MPLEIERRFLVRSRLLPPLGPGQCYEQAYLTSSPSVRVRLIDGEAAFLTIKGEGVLTREEYEYPIPLDDAHRLMRLSPWPAVVKTRFKLPAGHLFWEVDRFDGANAGLWAAEIELPSEDTAVELPPWIALEVTEERRFTNAGLARSPFEAWPDRERLLAVLSS